LILVFFFVNLPTRILRYFQENEFVRIPCTKSIEL
jgi:hypothetical protein